MLQLVRSVGAGAVRCAVGGACAGAAHVNKQ
jgi:hypothetical protein